MSITFWRIVYRRHTSFAQELISQVFNGTVGWGRRVSATVSRNGDLVYTGYLEIVLKRKVANDVDSSPYFPAEAAIESTELELGGQRIDLITSDFYRFYNELFRKDAEKDAYHRLTNFDDNTLDGVTKRFYLPLIFYWNRNPGLAIPLIALESAARKSHGPQIPVASLMPSWHGARFAELRERGKADATNSTLETRRGPGRNAPGYGHKAFRMTQSTIRRACATYVMAKYMRLPSLTAKQPANDDAAKPPQSSLEGQSGLYLIVHGDPCSITN